MNRYTCSNGHLNWEHQKQIAILQIRQLRVDKNIGERKAKFSSK